jgi:hypothetical protein
MKKQLAIAVGAVLAATLSAATAPTQAASKAKAPRFGKPVLLTTETGLGGYEPSIIVDKFNNVYVTAHKQNHNLVVSPDSASPTKMRSMSWIWYSADHKKFANMPGLTPAQEQNQVFGVEGDLAYDETGHVYFVDTNVADNSFSRWKATGRGKLALETTRPLGPFAQAVDDRPWITAHGDGTVMYIGNMGNKDAYPAGRSGDGDAYGPGRYTVYMSYDHGDSFDPLGYTLNGSGWCRPAADHRKGSKMLYVLCTDDAGTLYSYVSADDGRYWRRYKMGTYDHRDSWETYPSVSVGRDGTVYALYSETKAWSGDGKSTKLWMYTSKTSGRTWSKRDVTPQKNGLARYTWLDVAPNGTVGIAYYFRPNTSSDWHLYAATAKPGQKFAAAKVTTTPVASKSNSVPFGDFFMCAFGPDSKLHVAWTSMDNDLLAEGLNTDIYYAKQQ